MKETLSEASTAVNILMVDDHPENLLVLEAALKDMGHNLVQARSGSEALKRVLEEEFAVILLDIQMPNMDGFETATLIRQRGKSHHTPIIFLTAENKAETQVFHGYSVGAVDYLLKPIVPEILRAKVAVFVDLFIKTEQVRQHATLLRRLDREAYKKEMSQLKVQKNRIFDLSMDMICILGFDGRFKQLNPSWQDSLGFKANDLKGTPFLQWIHPEDQDAARAVWADLKNRGWSLSLENRCPCKDGSLKWLLWSFAAYPQEQLVYAVVRDITKRKKEEDQIRDLNARLELKVEKRTEELQRTIQELEAFSYSVSHDLRAPLRIADGYSRMLLEDHAPQLSAEGRRIVDTIRGNLERMARMIDDLLAFSKVSREEIAPDTVDMNELVGLVIEEIRASSGGTQAQFAVGRLPPARGDRSMIRQALTNLISNAVKYTRHTKEAKIQVGARTEGDKNIYHVQDNGAGFDMRHAEKLFRVFQRLHTEREFEGTGVGLAIVEQVVHRHGGRVWAQAKVNEGATFHFSLPKGEGVSDGEETDDSGARQTIA